MISSLLLPARRHPRPKRTRRGVGFLEYSLVIGLVVATVGYLLSSYFSASADTTTQLAVNNQQRVIAKIKELYVSHPSYDSIDLQAIAQYGGFPSNMVSGTTGSYTVRNAWGGTVTVAGSANTFTLTWAGIPSAGCIALTKTNTGSTQTTGLSALAINGSSITLPPSPTTVANACTTAGQGTSGGNSVAWTYIGA